MQDTSEGEAWIVKPASSACGRGIYITKDFSDLPGIMYAEVGKTSDVLCLAVGISPVFRQKADSHRVNSISPFEPDPPLPSCTLHLYAGPVVPMTDAAGTGSESNWIAQRYVENPLLLDGLKFDLRLYIAVTCFRPLRWVPWPGFLLYRAYWRMIRTLVTHTIPRKSARSRLGNLFSHCQIL